MNPISELGLPHIRNGGGRLELPGPGPNSESEESSDSSDPESEEGPVPKNNPFWNSFLIAVELRYEVTANFIIV